MEKHTGDYKVPSLKRKAIVQGHCHQNAIMKMRSEEKIFQDMGMDYQVLDSGCCGMAGYFGYEEGDKYEVSIKAGERVLLPAVRKADTKTLVIADGFSCREQIEQLTNREGLHTAQVLQMALHENGESESSDLDYPEKKYIDGMKLRSTALTIKRSVVFLSIVAIIGVYYLSARRKRKEKGTIFY